jgi:hypothetical protein
MGFFLSVGGHGALSRGCITVVGEEETVMVTLRPELSAGKPLPHCGTAWTKVARHYAFLDKPD